MKKEIKFPTILGLLLLTFSLFAGSYLTSQTTSLRSRASGDCHPQNLQITNITHSSFDLFFITSVPCSSALSLDGRLVNDFYQSDNNRLHYFQVDNLQPDHQYSFSIVSGGSSIDNPDYTLATAPQPSSQMPTSNLAWGKVFNPDSTPATKAIVYLIIPGASPLSAPVTNSGNWHISLAHSLTQDKTNWFTPPASAEEEIYVIAPDGQTTQLTHHTSANNPVPDIIIGQNYFSDSSASSTGQLTITNPVNSTTNQPNLSVHNPNEGETLNTANPNFFGTAPIGSKVLIEVESEQKHQDELLATDGNWSWSPPQSLEPGEHTLTVKSQDPDTLAWSTIVRRFFVLPSNDALAFTASASASTPTPTTLPTSVPTLVPTIIPTPTTSLPTPTDVVRAAQPDTSSGVPTTGFGLPTFALLAIAGLMILLSFTFIR